MGGVHPLVLRRIPPSIQTMHTHFYIEDGSEWFSPGCKASTFYEPSECHFFICFFNYALVNLFAIKIGNQG